MTDTILFEMVEKTYSEMQQGFKVVNSKIEIVTADNWSDIARLKINTKTHIG